MVGALFPSLGLAQQPKIAVPKGFPTPVVPVANPITPTKAYLGRLLFYDKRLSVNGSTSCATCHRQELAFTDGRARALGATGQLHPRGAMTLFNVAYNRSLNWSDPSTHSLEKQAFKPMFSTNPIELGLKREDPRVLKLIRTDPTYRPIFRRAFPQDRNPYTFTYIAKALATFERTIVSADSPYDRFRFGDPNAISESAKRGEILFFLDGGPSCFRCHGGFNFSDAVQSREPVAFHNTGLYNILGRFSYPPSNLGLFESTRRTIDIGKFRAPSLRNIALTAPYMHDGSIATLSDVLDHYASGGRTLTDGPLAGVGSRNPNKDPLIHGFRMTPRNRADLIAFLESLTDETAMCNPRFANPWLEGVPAESLP